MEIWQPIGGYEGLYEVSNFGRVRSVPRRLPHPINGFKTYPGVLLAYTKSKRDGYLRVSLYKSSHRKAYLVHRLVLLTFKGAPPVGEEACHVDGDPSNNVLANLRWGSPSSNNLDKYRHGTMQTKAVRRSDGALFGSLSEAGRLYGISVADICSTCKGRLFSAGGWGWSYA